MALAESEYLDVRDFPERMIQTAPGKAEKDGDANDLLAIRRQVLQGFERTHIVRLLKESGGNVSVAARQAGINRRTLYRLMRRYNIDLESIR
jgi:two-component system response regulator GlrR